MDGAEPLTIDAFGSNCLRLEIATMSRSPSAEAGPTVHLQMLVDWAPSRSPQLARFGALIKVLPNAVVAVPAAIEIRLRDEAGRVVGTSLLDLDPDEGDLVGPAWREVAGRLVRLADTVTQVDAVLGTSSSRRSYRSEESRSTMLVPIVGELGIAGEPHVWWRFSNHGESPIDVYHVMNSTIIWLDGQAMQAPPAPYNGPSHLPPGRSMSGLWSLDDLNRSARRGQHRLQISILGERSDEIEWTWS